MSVSALVARATGMDGGLEHLFVLAKRTPRLEGGGGYTIGRV